MFFFSMTRKFSSIILSGSVNTWTANQWLPITRSYRYKHFGLWPVTNVKYNISPRFSSHSPEKRGSPKVAEGKSCLSDSICVFSELDLHSANILDPIEMKTLALEMAEKKIGTKFVSRQFVTNWCNLMWFPWYWFEMWKSFRPNENVLGAFHSCPCVNLLMSDIAGFELSQELFLLPSAEANWQVLCRVAFKPKLLYLQHHVYFLRCSHFKMPS